MPYNLSCSSRRSEFCGASGTTICTKGSGTRANRDWQSVTISDGHDLCTFAAFRFTDLVPPFFCRSETRVDKRFTDVDCASSTEFARNRSHDPRHYAGANPLLKSPMTGLERGVSVG